MIVNLTPHTLNLVDEDGTEIVSIPPSGTVARVATRTVRVGETVEGAPLYQTQWGEVENLPGPSHRAGNLRVVGSAGRGPKGTCPKVKRKSPPH